MHIHLLISTPLLSGPLLPRIYLSACVPLSTQTQSIWLCEEAQRQCFYWGPALLLTRLAWVLWFSQTPFLSSDLKRLRPSGTRSHCAASHQDRLRLQPALHLRGPRSGRKLGGAPQPALHLKRATLKSTAHHKRRSSGRLHVWTCQGHGSV